MEWLEREWSARGEARAGDSEAAPLRESVGA
jgi:hypothetical protein